MATERATVAESETSRDQPIHLWLRDLQSPRRSEASQHLAELVCNRLSAIAEYLNRTAAPAKPVLRECGHGIKEGVTETLLQNRPQPITVREFGVRAAAVIRERLLGELDKVPDDGTPAGTRLNWWYEFHRAAGELSEDLRMVHDLMFYFHFPIEQTAEFLELSVSVVTQRKEEAVRRLRPLFDRARGKV